MAGWHYDEIQTIEGLEIAGIWDIREERRDYAAHEAVLVLDADGVVIACHAQLGDDVPPVLLAVAIAHGAEDPGPLQLLPVMGANEI